jgi:hypothetical protein
MLSAHKIRTKFMQFRWAPLQDAEEDYAKLYGHVIRDVVLKEDPLRPYVSGSPTNGIKSEEENFISKTVSPWSTIYGDSKKELFLAN